MMPKTPAFVGLLDTYSGAAAAYSLRRLSSTYTGSCIRVRRANNNVEQDIGFVNNVVDTATMNTFLAGSGGGYVTKIYDQSGNGRDVAQTTATKQMLIYDYNIGLYSLNGKTAMQSSGNAGMGFSVANFPGATSYSISSVFSAKDEGWYTKLLSIGPDATNSGVWYTVRTAGTALGWVTGDTGLAGNGYNNSPRIISNGQIIPNSDTTQNILLGVLSSTNAKMYRNGSQISYRVNTTGNCYNTTDTLIVGNAPNGVNTFSGYLQELVIWQSDQNSNASGINSNTNSYWGTY